MTATLPSDPDCHGRVGCDAQATRRPGVGVVCGDILTPLDRRR